MRRAYNRATYWPERVALMQVWADLLGEFRFFDHKKGDEALEAAPEFPGQVSPLK